ncbi:nucleopolyhedrovirus P10 family protein, partial [Streptomyces sp. SID6137]|nr:nucleopolyhedrovirus P10 family protein [Streptomyces sp. SID6137]
MTDAWTQVVRHHVGLGRMLPLGEPEDGAWIAEDAAGAVLRGAAADGLPGVRLGVLRIGLADPQRVAEPVVPAPPSALPP